MNYGLLRVARDGNISRFLIVNVADERTALARARDFADNRTVEVWCGGRQIASLGSAAVRLAALELCR